MSEEVFKQFLVFLASKLDENQELLKLVQKRYDECDDAFRISTDFQVLVDDVQTKMESENHRIFVHLKEFLSKLKSHGTGSSKKRRKQDGLCDNLAKRLCTGNSCSDLSSDSDFFKKVKGNGSNKDLKNDLSSVKSNSPKDTDASNSPSSSTEKKTDENSKVGLGNSRDKPETISDDESLSLDSVRSDTESSDNSDLPLYSNSKFVQEPESVSVDSVSSESKYSRLTSPSTSKLSLNMNTKTLSSEKAETATKSSRSPVSVAIPETHVVIDEGSCSDLPSPTESSVVNVYETNTGTQEDAEEVNADKAEEEERQRKKKKGSERQVKRLEKLLGEIRDEIEKATKVELSMEDLEKDDSSYVYEDRLQKKFIKVWEKLCELKGQDTSTGRPIEKKFRFDGTRYAEVNKRIEKFINKKKIFPDYNDIKKIVTQVNTHYNLYLGKAAIDDLAREAFTDVGNQLQDRRHRNFILTFGSSQTEGTSITEDPALYNSSLRKKLEDNRKLAKNRLDEVISKYAKKQYETNAQPEEVDDNAIESSSEEEEEETQDIPELDEVMALSDGDEDEVSEIPGKSSENTDMPFTKNLKVQIEKLEVPPGLLKKKVPSTVTSERNINQKDTLTNTTTALAIPNTGLRQLPPRSAASMSNQRPTRCLTNSRDRNATSDEIVIDLDSSSDADDGAEIISSTQPMMALVPRRTPRFSTNTISSSNSTTTSTMTSSSSSSSSTSTSSTMVMSSQNRMQFSMQVKTQYQQQQKDGFSLKIASVSSLAYSIKDSNRNTQYFTSQQTNFQNQGIRLTPGNNYKQNTNRPRLPAPSNSVIVLSDSD